MPLVKTNRYASLTEDNLESELKKTAKGNYLNPQKKFKIQLANYRWFGDLTLDSDMRDENKNCGQWTWTQEYEVSKKYKLFLGSGDLSFCAASSDSRNPSWSSARYGFRSILEEIP